MCGFRDPEIDERIRVKWLQSGTVTLDVIHLVFAAFGDVHKIATFEKAAGFQVCGFIGYIIWHRSYLHYFRIRSQVRNSSCCQS